MTELSKTKYLMIVSKRLSGIRCKLKQSEFLVYTYLIFLAGFFLSPSNHLHRNFYYLFVVLPFLISLDSKLIKSCIRSKLFQLSLLSLLYFWASMFWTDARLSSEEYYDLSRYFLMLIVFIVATMMLLSRSDKFAIQLNFWLCIVALAAAFGFILFFYASHNFPQDRLIGPFDYTHNPNQAAMHFGFVGIISFYSLIYSKIKLHKFFYLLVLLISFVYIMLCQSRGPLLAIFFSVILGFILERHWLAIAAIISLCIAFILLVEFGDFGIRSLIARGMADRTDIWMVTAKRLLQAPILGEGYFTDVSIDIERSLETSPHNLLLLVMLKSGLVGGGLLFILVLNALFRSYKFYKASGNWIYLCLLNYFIVCMTFDSVHLLYKPSLAWLIFWLPVGLLASQEIVGENPQSITN